MRRARKSRSPGEAALPAATSLPELGRLRGTRPLAASHSVVRFTGCALLRLALGLEVGRVVGALDPARSRELEQVALAEVLVDELLVVQEAEADARPGDLGEVAAVHQLLQLVGVGALARPVLREAV